MAGSDWPVCTLSGDYISTMNIVIDYAQQFPAVFYRFGTTDPQGQFTAPLHSATYMADETALITAMSNLAWLALSFLEED